MDINQPIDKDQQYVISGESMERLVQLALNLQTPGVEVKGSIFDYPLIVREIVADAEKAPDIGNIIMGIEGATS